MSYSNSPDPSVEVVVIMKQECDDLRKFRSEMYELLAELGDAVMLPPEPSNRQVMDIAFRGHKLRVQQDIAGFKRPQK